jgi:hypothetical protein
MIDTELQRHRSRKPWIIAIAVIGLVLFVPAYLAWYVFVPHRHDPGAATTPADVQYYTSVPPPPEARDLRIAAFEYGQARFSFVRFRAPADVCRAYAAKVLPNTTLAALTDDQTYNDLMALYLGSYQLNDLRWFDLPYAKSFWSTQAGQPVFQKPEIDRLPKTPNVSGVDANTEKTGYLTSSIRIDEANGVFYFFQVN